MNWFYNLLNEQRIKDERSEHIANVNRHVKEMQKIIDGNTVLTINLFGFQLRVIL